MPWRPGSLTLGVERGSRDKETPRRWERAGLPGNGLWGFPYIVVNVLFLLQVTLVGFDSEQKFPGTGHVCDFAPLFPLRDDLCGTEEGEGGCEAGLKKKCPMNGRLLTGASVPENGDQVQLRLALGHPPHAHTLGSVVEALWDRFLFCKDITGQRKTLDAT